MKFDTKGAMPAVIAVVFLTFFGLALFGPSIWPGFKPPSEAMMQTLINLTIAAVMFYIGTTQASARKDETIAGLSGPPTPLAVAPVKIDDSTPVQVQEVKP